MIIKKTNYFNINLFDIIVVLLITTIIAISLYHINRNIKINRLFESAQTAYETKNYEEAISTLKKVIALDSDNSNVTKLLEIYQEKNQNYKDAKILANKISNERNLFLAKKGYNNYKVEVTIPYQMVYIYKNNNLIKTMICSTGIESKPTPTGYYEMNGKGTYFFNEKYGEGGFYWMNFSNNIYLFHSVPVDYNKNIIISEEEKLGEKASHGCVRLAMNDAEWFYNNVPCDDTLVYIH